jgi:hypothetical protein
MSGKSSTRRPSLAATSARSGQLASVHVNAAWGPAGNRAERPSRQGPSARAAYRRSAYPRVVSDKTIYEELSEEECFALLNRGGIGRLAGVEHGRPFIFPVNYGVDNGVVLFRTSPGTKLSGSGFGRVAFEIDGIDAEREVVPVVVEVEVAVPRLAPTCVVGVGRLHRTAHQTRGPPR